MYTSDIPHLSIPCSKRYKYWRFSTLTTSSQYILTKVLTIYIQLIVHVHIFPVKLSSKWVQRMCNKISWFCMHYRDKVTHFINIFLKQIIFLNYDGQYRFRKFFLCFIIQWQLIKLIVRYRIQIKLLIYVRLVQCTSVHLFKYISIKKTPTHID